MSWTCLECGCANPESVFICEGCGKSLQRRIHLVGTLKTLSFHKMSDVGRVVYRRLVGDDAKYADDIQFRLQFDGEIKEWALVPNPKAPQRVLVNGAAIDESSMYVLRTGDVIELGSRHRDAKVAAITVQVDD